ncbi:zinc finger protein 91 isoform X15 [Bicyclus anynana]|uniref:Zinc finger protein 91 isoform X15 n=1 Tax=Bicyclus anynana TaxID=110368 RepID=A0ABM3M241_BICAN|nr:zinc finger protein 91 isoform X15 [Bicyclus anynana]
MAAKTSEWRPGPTVCRCCLSEGCYKDISTEYFWMGKREVYSEMLSDTFDLSISYSKSGGPNSASRLICEPCIGRLRDAAEFKRQVQECEKTFVQCLDPVTALADMQVTLELEKEVKVEMVKEEKMRLSDDDDYGAHDYGDDDDDYDDLDDQPLTKLASKIPKKEDVDVLDLLDNAKVTEKRKSSTKVKGQPSKKSKCKQTAGSSKQQKPEPKKKKGNRPTSIWQLTVAERNNAATFIQYTTVIPFVFMGWSFKCFYCAKYFSDVPSLLDHTSKHDVLNRDLILEKYISRGKRTLQVDISKLKCRLCDKVCPNLEDIRSHLIHDHEKHFRQASNGMTEYNMESKNGYFVCHICNKEFPSFSLINSHMNMHFGKVVCENCGAAFLNQHTLMKHREKHLQIKFSCQQCNKVFLKRSQLKYHSEVKHKGKVMMKKCNLCPETFKEHYGKMVHMKVAHGVVTTYQCHVCKTNFNSRRTLTEHTTRYHTEKFKCELCSKCFSIESKLKQHMRGHTGERNFVCPICKNAYMHSMTLRKHMKTHEPIFKFSCSECPTGFNNKDDYTNHVNEWHMFDEADD